MKAFEFFLLSQIGLEVCETRQRWCRILRKLHRLSGCKTRIPGG